MTEAEKKMKRYMHQVERRLALPRELRSRVMNDLISSVVARREAGQGDEEILAELGSPEKVAQELNEQMKEFVRPKSKWRFLCWGLAILGGAELIACLASRLWLRFRFGPSSIGIIGGADGPTAIFVTSTIDARGLLTALALLLAGVAGLLFLRWKRMR